MSRCWVILACSALLAAQEPGTPAKAEAMSAKDIAEARIRALLDEIETIAASEPPIIGIDTQLRLAGALGEKRPADAARVMRDSGSRIMTIRDLPTRSVLLADWMKLQANLNLTEAESMYRVYLADYFTHELRWDEAEAIIQFAGQTKKQFPSLSQEAEKRAKALHLSPSKQKGKPSKSGGLFADLFRSKTKEMDAEEKISFARKQEDIGYAITLLLEVIDEAQLTPQRRLSLASEALSMTTKLEPGDDRLVAQSMLTRRLYEAGDRPGAATAAQMLSESFEKRYDCETAACDTLRDGENPGEIINAFAEYLQENNIPLESLGLSHQSLRVRLLIQDLARSLSGGVKE